jgi:hypothetical protein
VCPPSSSKGHTLKAIRVTWPRQQKSVGIVSTLRCSLNTIKVLKIVFSNAVEGQRQGCAVGHCAGWRRGVGDEGPAVGERQEGRRRAGLGPRDLQGGEAGEEGGEGECQGEPEDGGRLGSVGEEGPGAGGGAGTGGGRGAGGVQGEGAGQAGQGRGGEGEEGGAGDSGGAASLPPSLQACLPGGAPLLSPGGAAWPQGRAPLQLACSGAPQAVGRGRAA